MNSSDILVVKWYCSDCAIEFETEELFLEWKADMVLGNCPKCGMQLDKETSDYQIIKTNLNGRKRKKIDSNTWEDDAWD